MFYPDSGCGNCKTVAARDKKVHYSISGESKFIHYAISILDKKTGKRSATQAAYLPPRNGVFANLSDSSGLYITLFCSTP